MTILHLLAAPPRTPANTRFWQRVPEDLSAGQTTSAYLLHEGASALLDPRLAKLIGQGLRLFACPRAVDTFAPEAKVELVLGGPGLLAELIERSASVESYNPS